MSVYYKEKPEYLQQSISHSKMCLKTTDDFVLVATPTPPTSHPGT